MNKKEKTIQTTFQNLTVIYVIKCKYVLSLSLFGHVTFTIIKFCMLKKLNYQHAILLFPSQPFQFNWTLYTDSYITCDCMYVTKYIVTLESQVKNNYLAYRISSKEQCFSIYIESHRSLEFHARNSDSKKVNIY